MVTKIESGGAGKSAGTKRAALTIIDSKPRKRQMTQPTPPKTEDRREVVQNAEEADAAKSDQIFRFMDLSGGVCPDVLIQNR